jgi:hypothetical protein
MVTTCSLSSPLSHKQKTVWSLLSKGLTVANIAEKLKTTRQFINQTKLAAEEKLSTTLLEVAQTNDLLVTKLYPKEAILVGYHPALKRKAIITYNTNHGIKVWYWYDDPEEVTNQEFLNQTRNYLLDLAAEKGIQIENAKNTHPAKLADIIFSTLIPEINRNRH